MVIQGIMRRKDLVREPNDVPPPGQRFVVLILSLEGYSPVYVLDLDRSHSGIVKLESLGIQHEFSLGPVF